MSPANPKPTPEKSKSADAARRKAESAKPAAAKPPAPEPVPPMFRRVDWLAALLTFAIIWVTYLITIAPEVTLEDSGELCTASFYAGIPHAPGYPVWSIYSWLWTVLLPVGNVAWRVAVGEATAGAVSCGLLALMVSRGSSMFVEGIEDLKGMTGKWEKIIFFVPFFLTMLILTLRWIYAPHQYRFLYWALFMYGLSITTHQSLMVASVGLEVLIAVRSPRTGRDIFLGNFVIYALMWIWYWANGSFIFPNITKGGMFVLFNLVGWGSLAASIWLAIRTRGILTEFLPVVIMGSLCILGVSFYFYEPLSCMTNPPMER